MNDEAFYFFIDEKDRQLSDILQAFVEGAKQISWKRVKAPRLIKVWRDFGKMGVVRDIKGLQNIKDRILKNIVRLHITTALSGHSQLDPQDLINEADFEIDLSDDIAAERFYWEYLSSEKYDYISDYGLPQLEKLFGPIFNEDKSDELLYLIDRVLNVVHQRFDLAELFVEGGTDTLLEISS